MRNVLPLILSSALLTGCVTHNYRYVVTPTQSRPQEYTVANLRLDTERPFGATDEEVRVLNDTSLILSTTFQKKPEYTKTDATNILTAIHKAIEAMHFNYESNGFFFEGLRSCNIDCDSRSTLYMGQAERANLPLKAVLMPYHMFVRWRFPDGTHMNWETTMGDTYSDEGYTNLVTELWCDDGIPQGTIKMDEMNLNEFAVWCSNVARENIRARHNHLDPTREKRMADVFVPLIRYLDAKIEKDPKSLELRVLRADMYWKGIEDSKRALAEYNSVLRLDPDNKEVKDKRNKLEEWMLDIDPFK